MNRKFLRFVVAGGVAAAANVGSRFVFSHWVSYEWAIVFAFLVGVTVAFLLMRNYVFEAKNGPLTPQIAKFLVVNLLGLLQTFLVSVLLARWALPAVGLEAHAETLGHLVGVAIPMVSSYFGHSLGTFR